MSHKKYREEKNCLNCGAEVMGRFCQNCGQENIEQRDNFFHMVGHFISDYLHFDSKFFRSLIPLIIKPGYLTKEYWEGKRAQFIPPLRMFFFVTIIFMLCTSYFYNRFGSKLKHAIVNRDPGLASLDSAQIAAMPDTSKIFVQRWNQTVTVKDIRESWVKEVRQQRKLHEGIDMVFKNLKYVTFFLLPIYALIFKMLFFRRKSYYIDHLIYTMHLQSFGYILLSVLLVVPFVLPVELALLRQVLFFIILLYIGISLHRLYHQQIWKTVLKSFLATVMIFFITILAVVGTAAIDAVFIQ